MLKAIVVMSSVLAASPALAQDWMAPNATPKTELLWPGAVPGAVGTEDADKPTLTVYLPSKGQATGAGIVICPGGGYRNLAMDHEGFEVARWLSSRGIAGFVLKYRLGPRYHHPAMLQDVLRAIRVSDRARTNSTSNPIASASWGSLRAATWHLQPRRSSTRLRRKSPTASTP